jgi:hypothetical protein
MLPALRNWESHDFAVKMLDWSAVQGSKLAYRCRRCGRSFQQFTAASRDIWAVDDEGRGLASSVSNQWLSGDCPRRFSPKDDDDRKQLSKFGVNS